MPIHEILARADDPTNCCLLFHVRSATISVGSVQFICFSIAVCLFAMGTLHNDEQRWLVSSITGNELTSGEAKKQSDRISLVAQHVSASNDTTYVERSAVSGSSTGKADSTKRGSTTDGCGNNQTSCSSNSTRSKSDPFMISDELSGRLVTICVLSLGVLVTLMLVTGALRRRAALLIPYLCVQLVDLCTTLVNWTAALSGNERRQWLANHSLFLPDALVRSRIEGFSDSAVLFLILLVGSATIMLKLIWLQCVWNCYKFVVRYRVNEAAMHFASSGFEDAFSGVSSQRRAPLSVGRISAWRRQLASEVEADGMPAAAAATADVEEQELAGLMPPKYEDVVPGDSDRPPTPNYAPPPYFEPCVSNSQPDSTVIPMTTVDPFRNDRNADNNSDLLLPQFSCEELAALTSMQNATDDVQLVLTEDVNVASADCVLGSDSQNQRLART